MRFDFDYASFAGLPVAEAAPWPVFGLCHQAAGYRVAVHVTEFFSELPLGEDVEVVVAGLPEVLAVAFEALRGFVFEDVESYSQGVGFGFGDEEMDVLGHEDVAVEKETVTSAESFEFFEECGAGVVVVEVGEPTVATEGDEVVVTLVLIAFEAGGHGLDGHFTFPPVTKCVSRMGHPECLWPV